jgi:predicted dehydrogenase
MAEVKVGIVGATITQGGSGWGANAHVPALKTVPGYELWAVCTARAETATASAAQFGAELAYHDFDTMIANPEIGVISVVVRVPGHHSLVMRALEAGKAVYCEWPLGANLAEAREMADLARARGVRTAVGLQARSDPAHMHARELVEQGYVGDVLSVRLGAIGQTIARRGNGRIWQGDRRNGANTLTIAGGHAIDALCFILGEFSEVSARLKTQVTEWHNTDTGETMIVDSPDWISVNGRLQRGAEVSILVATVPSAPAGNRLEIHGTKGTLVISGGSANVGPSQLHGTHGDAALAAIEVPERFRLAPESTPAGPARNVGQAYARFIQSLSSGQPFHPDFDHAVTRHALIEAMERSSDEGRTIRL